MQRLVTCLGLLLLASVPGLGRAATTSTGTTATWQVFAPQRPLPLYAPSGAAVDSHGDLYIADTGNNRVIELSPRGTLITSWGGVGSDPGQLDTPTGLALGGRGAIYVADSGNGRIEKFAASGRFITAWSWITTSTHAHVQPLRIATDRQGYVYVFLNARDNFGLEVRKYSWTGRLLRRWKTTIHSHIDTSFTSDCPTGTCYGEIAGYDPLAVAIGPRGTIYLSIRVEITMGKGNGTANFVQKLSPRGSWLAEWPFSGGDDTSASHGPESLAVDRNGDLLVTATDTSRIVTYWPSGRRRSIVGNGPGCGPGQFALPTAIAVGGAGNIFVADSANGNVQKVSPRGQPLALWNGCPQIHVTFPLGIAVNAMGDVFVAEALSNHISELSPAGATIARFGVGGAGPGQFNFPSGVAVDNHGNIYVADTRNNRIQKLSPRGRPLAQWGSFGTGAGQFNNPEGVAVDGSGNIYIADTKNNRVQKLSPAGQPLAQWGSFGRGPGQFYQPMGVAVDAQGDVYVTDSSNSRVQTFSPGGRPLSQWGSFGPYPGQLSGPVGIAVDRAGDVFVADTNNNRIQEFSSSGRILGMWGTQRSDFLDGICNPVECRLGPGYFGGPFGVAVGPDGSLYATDTGYNRIQTLRIRHTCLRARLHVAEGRAHGALCDAGPNGG